MRANKASADKFFRVGVSSVMAIANSVPATPNSIPIHTKQHSPHKCLRTPISIRLLLTMFRGTAGTAESAGATGKSFVAPDVAPTVGKLGQSVSFAVISSYVDDDRVASGATHANPCKTSKKALSAVFADKAFEVEDNGVEPMTSCMPCKRSSQLS